MQRFVMPIYHRTSNCNQIDMINKPIFADEALSPLVKYPCIELWPTIRYVVPSYLSSSSLDEHKAAATFLHFTSPGQHFAPHPM